jgi:CDP-glucose 4,6-dehydratase
MHFLVTGHTGFKGAWLTLMLAEQGHEVSGLALDPEPGALFETADLNQLMAHDIRADIRDAAAVGHALATIRPDAVFHMAAQPLVRESYLDPRWTIETNVIGTLNVLEAVQRSPSVSAQVVVTTDKVYRNINQTAGYVEKDALGGHDPYSASKAMADLLTQSWVASFDGPPTAIARAGNVIGGGDISRDRLMPDLLRAFADGRPAEIRFPGAVRPWQHVLDCLNGYRLLMAALLDGSQQGGEWNFGPGPESFVTVGEVAALTAELWGHGAEWSNSTGSQPHEALLLALDATRARRELNWHDALTFRDAVGWSVNWARECTTPSKARSISLEQIRNHALISHR